MLDRQCKNNLGHALSRLQYLVVVVLRGAPGVEPQVQAPRPGDVHRLLELVVVPDRVHRLHRLPSGPRGRDLEAGQEPRLFPLIQDPGGAESGVVTLTIQTKQDAYGGRQEAHL